MRHRLGKAYQRFWKAPYTSREHEGHDHQHTRNAGGEGFGTPQPNSQADYGQDAMSPTRQPRRGWYCHQRRAQHDQNCRGQDRLTSHVPDALRRAWLLFCGMADRLFHGACCNMLAWESASYA